MNRTFSPPAPHWDTTLLRTFVRQRQRLQGDRQRSCPLAVMFRVAPGFGFIQLAPQGSRKSAIRGVIPPDHVWDGVPFFP